MEFNVENYLSNLSYINKDFPSLWNEILETVPKLTNKWIPSEANESDPLVVLLKELAIIADKQNYNIDKNILELFPATLTQLRSAYNVYESLGYTPDWYVSATTGITITYTGMVDGERLQENASTDPIEIPKWTQVSDDEGENIYTLMESIKEIVPGTPGKYSVIAMQGTLNDFEVNGSTQITLNNLDTQNRLYFNEYNIAQNGIIISNFSDFSDYNYEQMSGTSVTENENYEYYNKWRRVTNLNQYTAGNRIYKLGIDNTTNNIYLQFPDDIGNLIGDGIYIKYILSDGEEGNIGKNDISQIINESGFSNNNESNPTTLQASDFVVTNTKSSQNGKNPLDIDEMRREFNKTIGVFNTLVTLRDYENYLYEYTDNNGDNVVSNIRVSDRYNDLTDTISYKEMSPSGIVSDISKVLTYEKDGQPVERMTAYDIKFYPLTPVSPIETENDLNTTFTTLTSLSSIEEVIDNVKCISHDFARDENGNTIIGNPVLIPYDLNGQIYLQTAVSNEEASEISTKVYSQLLQSLNSREMEWGDSVNYGEVVDTIKNADNRIQYVALDAIEYKEPEELPEDDISNIYDVTKRNILIGNKAWTEYDQFVHGYNETNSTITGPGTVIGSDTINKIESISTDISIGTEGGAGESASAFVVNDNETFTILIPQYNTVTTYGNYLYYVAKNGSTSDFIAPASVPYELKDNQNIYIFETRDAAEAFILNNNAEYSYLLGPGTIIKCSSDVKFLNSSGPFNYINMGSSITIDILERASGILRTSDNIASSGNSSIGLLIATNSNGLVDVLNGSSVNNSYTLLSDEYLFYTDDLGVELGIISEGTTISLDGGFLTGIEVLSPDNVEDILNGSKLSNSNIWKRVTSQNTQIKYELNELFTFGSNYVIAFLNKNEDTYTASAVSKEILEMATSGFAKLPETVNVIKYTQLDENGEVTDSTVWEELSQTLGNDPYSILIRMALITGPGVVQNIKNTEANENLTINGIKLNTLPTSQSVTFEYSTAGSNGSSSIPAGFAIQTSKLITYQGGNPLILMGNEQDVSFYSYVEANSNITYDDAGFISISSLEGIENLTIPGIANTAAVIPYIVSTSPNNVSYMVARAGTTCITISKEEESGDLITASFDGTDVKNIIKLGRPYLTVENSTYYKGAENSPKVLDIITSGDAAKLTTDEIYIEGYCPIYTPTEEDLISDPTLPSSYFLDQHPYNRYVLPKLDNINITISPLSITR